MTVTVTVTTRRRRRTQRTIRKSATTTTHDHDHHDDRDKNGAPGPRGRREYDAEDASDEARGSRRAAAAGRQREHRPEGNRSRQARRSSASKGRAPRAFQTVVLLRAQPHWRAPRRRAPRPVVVSRQRAAPVAFLTGREEVGGRAGAPGCVARQRLATTKAAAVATAASSAAAVTSVRPLPSRLAAMTFSDAALPGGARAASKASLPRGITTTKRGGCRIMMIAARTLRAVAAAGERHARQEFRARPRPRRRRMQQ
jgi:hypothetical protein